MLLSSLWHNPLEFVRFWGGKIVPALFFGSFVFISRKYIWTICVHLLIDVWLIANMFYYNANALFLSYETMKMADNMTGFWDSLLSYTEWGMLLYPIMTLLYVCCILFIPNSNKRIPLVFYITLFVTLLISIIDNFCYKIYMHGWNPDNEATNQVNSRMLGGRDFYHYYPFGNVYYFACIETSMDYNAWAYCYVKDYSIISYFPACFVYNILRPAGEIITLTEKEVEQIKPFFVEGETALTIPEPRNNLIFVLFESLESWPVNEVCGYDFMPNLQLLSKSEHSLYCDKLKSQVRHGNSADGQMIDITGLLPISNGATCRLYEENIFSSYAECFLQSAIINPSPGMWAQEKMTKGYRFKELIEPTKGEHWADKELVEQMINYIDTVSEPFCVFGITVSSHVPFSYGSVNPMYTVANMPEIMLAYLNCLYYTDSLVGKLVAAVQNNEKLATSTTIVISGDHTIFRNEDKQIDQFALEHNINMKTTSTFTPLIIYSPLIDENVCVTDTCYQMDIYPTILHLIGCEDYYWKGFGANLLDSTARHNRPITEKEAYKLSDKIIRSNYFSTYSN